MSKEYVRHSSSQKTIGSAVIATASAEVKKRFPDAQTLYVLDIACGPGNLTIDLKEELQKTLPDALVDVTGLDYSPGNISHLVQKTKGDIRGVTGSFYDLPMAAESMDMITSNEGLHWQPPYAMSEIIYTQLPPEEKTKYEVWAMTNFQKSTREIHEALKPGGVAVVQFGHEGQLKKLWNVIQSVLQKEPFVPYKSQVNFPLFYPTIEQIRTVFAAAGFPSASTEVHAFTQDMTEETPETISGFLQAFTRPGFSRIFPPEQLEDFYHQIEAVLSRTDLTTFRKDQWHRTLIGATK